MSELIPLGTRVEAELALRVQRLAKRTERSSSQLIRWALLSALPLLERDESIALPPAPASDEEFASSLANATPARRRALSHEST